MGRFVIHLADVVVDATLMAVNLNPAHLAVENDRLPHVGVFFQAGVKKTQKAREMLASLLLAT
jgi:hypothetical protein